MGNLEHIKNKTEKQSLKALYFYNSIITELSYNIEQRNNIALILLAWCLTFQI